MNPLSSLQWRNLNSERNYPFCDSASLVLGTITFIPQTFIIDARIYIAAGYQPRKPPYVSKIVITDTDLAIHISCDGVAMGIATYATARNSTAQQKIDTELASGVILKEGKVIGNLVVGLKSLDLFKTIGPSSYDLNPEDLPFLPSVCDYLPGPQVTSLNDLVGSVTLQANTGVRFTKLNATDVKVDIVGDPHFTRYGCILDPSTPAAAYQSSLSRFLEQLVIIHYLEASSTQPVKTILKVNRTGVRKDGSINFQLQTLGDGLGATERPAFRLNAQGSTLTLSMVGDL